MLSRRGFQACVGACLLGLLSYGGTCFGDDVKPGDVMTNSIGMRLVLIPAGEFMMGESKPHEHEKDNLPVHRVRITKPFYMGQHEVTKGQFRKFVEATGFQTEEETDDYPAAGWNPAKREYESKHEYSWRSWGVEETDEHPVVYICWNDAVAFCEWLSKAESCTYRLPTEAEWEYACRAGTTTRHYHGDDPEGLIDTGNVADASHQETVQWDVDPERSKGFRRFIRGRDGYPFTAPVGQFRPNAFGIYDMHGNVWEWCADAWDRGGYYARSPVDDPTGPTPEVPDTWPRACRGGNWALNPNLATSAYRYFTNPTSYSNVFGFRVARNVDDGE